MFGIAILSLVNNVMTQNAYLVNQLSTAKLVSKDTCHPLTTQLVSLPFHALESLLQFNLKD
jgi:hypothetical protein